MTPRVLLALATLAPGAADLWAQARDFEFRRDLAAGERFLLRNIVGDVAIEPGSGRALEVTAVKREGRHGDPADVEIRAVDLDGGVAICVFYPGTRRRDGDEDRDRRAARRSGDPCSREGRWGNNDRNDTRVDFTVRLPADLVVDLKTVAGDVTGRGLRGDLDLGTVSGHLRLTGVHASTVEASSVSGDVELGDVDARDVSAETVSGDVTYTGSLRQDGRYDFKTLSGDVEITLPAEPDATLRGTTFSGRFYSDFPTASEGRRRRNRFNATWGGGSASIDVESFSGDVRIRSATR